MYDFLLTIHFFGLAIGAGTPFYMAALAIQAERSRDPATVRAVMLGPGAAVSAVGIGGLVLLILSGTVMVVSWGGIGDLEWPFAAKISLAVAVALYVAFMKLLSRRAKREQGMATMATIRKLAPIGPVLSISVIALSVLAFN